MVVVVIRGAGLKRKLEEFRVLPCWESVSRADPLFCRSLRTRPTPVLHADARFERGEQASFLFSPFLFSSLLFSRRPLLPSLSLSLFPNPSRHFLGKWPRSPTWQRVVNAVSPRFSPVDSCPPLLAPTSQPMPPPIRSLTLALIRLLGDLNLMDLCL